MKRFCVKWLVVLAVFCSMMWAGIALAQVPWQDSELRAFSKNNSAWTVPEVVSVTGTTLFAVDLTKSGVILLNTRQSGLAGTSIYFVPPTSNIPTRNRIIFPGNGQHIVMATASGYAPIAFPGSATNTIMNGNTLMGRTYVLDVMSGVDELRGVAGSTVFVVSGVSVYE